MFCLLKFGFGMFLFDVNLKLIFLNLLILGVNFLWYLDIGLILGVIWNEFWSELDLEMEINFVFGFLEFIKFYWDLWIGEIWVIIFGLMIGFGCFGVFFWILSKVFYCGGRFWNLLVFLL